MKKNQRWRFLKNRFLKKSCIRCSLVMFLSLWVIFPSGAQNREHRVTLQAEQLQVVDILKEMEKQVPLKFMYHDEDLQRLGRKDLQVRSMPFREALNQVLQGSQISYEVVGDQVVFKRNPAQGSQTRIITGAVVDKQGQPLPGATIAIEGTTTGAVADREGKFTLSISATGETVLVVTFVGFQKQSVKAGRESQLRIVMEEDITQVEEVVVTGYSTIPKSSYVGAITVVRAEDIYVAGETSIDQMLQGVIPGMSVLTRSGQVGATAKIRIRGTSTILGNQEPVWVVDGVIQRDPLPVPEGDATMLGGDATELRLIASNAISWLNPNDIETITVLKDASATAIYGSQAANGVIVISTKKARPGQLSISYSGDFSIGQKPHYGLYDLMNSQELMQFSKEMYLGRDSYTQPVLPIGYAGLVEKLQNKEISYATMIEEYRKMENQNTDWFDLLFRNNFSHNHNVSFYGGTEKIMNRTSFGIQQQKGEAKGNDLLSMTANSNTTLRFGERVTLSLQLNGSIRETKGFAYGVDPFSYAYNTSRTLPMYNEDGTFFYHEKRGEGSTAVSGKYTYRYNIQNELDNTGQNNITKMVGTTLDLRVKLWNWLEYQSLLSYSASSSESKRYATELSFFITQKRGYEYGDVLPNSPEELASRLPFGGLVQIEDATNRSYTFRNSLVYNKSFNELHRLTLQLGFEMNSSTTNGNSMARYGYLRYRGEGFASVPLSHTRIGVSGSDLHEEMRANTKIVDTESNKISEYFTAVYGYNERYILNFNARVDASNRFGQDKNKRFQPTWSVGGKWRLGNESFMRYVNWLNSFDLSASYGYQGNAVDAVSPHLIATDGGHSTMFKQYTLNIKSLPYPDLGWEKTKTWNFSADFAMWGGRVSFTANMYKKTSDVLDQREVLVENGLNSAIIFGSRVINKGYDFIVSMVPIRTKDFMWQFSLNSGVARNRVEENQRIDYRYTDFTSGGAIVNGEAYSTFYSFAFDKLNPNTGHPTFKYLDLEDVTENARDFLVKSGKLEPDFSGGFNTMFRYKTFSLRAQFAMSFGAQGRLPVFYNTSGAPTPEQNAPRLLKDRWKKTGDEAWTNIPAVPAGNPIVYLGVSLPLANRPTLTSYELYNLSDIRVANADFIRCRQISLSYDLTSDLLKKLYAKRVGVSLSMSNPFLITFDKAWKGYDPETKGWPARRTTSLSVNMTF